MPLIEVPKFDPAEELTKEFVEAWNVAGAHLQMSGGEGIRWLRTDPLQPFGPQFFSFLLGNQLFFVFVAMEGVSQLEGFNRKMFEELAKSAKGWGCIMNVEKTAGKLIPSKPGWGLVDLNNNPIDPPSLVSDEQIEMSDWEIHDFAVKVVREFIATIPGVKDISWNSHLNMDPTIWFEGKDGSEWIIVRGVRYPQMTLEVPSNLEEIKKVATKTNQKGHFACVAAANHKNKFNDLTQPPLPIYRGYLIEYEFEGLKDFNGTVICKNPIYLT